MSSEARPTCTCVGEGPDYHDEGCSQRTTWNYRGCIERTDDGPIFTVREVYYGPNGALSWTAEPCYPQADSWKDLCEELILMERGAMATPYLDITELPGVWVDRNGKPLSATEVSS